MNGITGLGDGCPVYLRSRARFIGLFIKFRSRWSFAEEIKEAWGFNTTTNVDLVSEEIAT